jgi:hypothetical protein
MMDVGLTADEAVNVAMNIFQHDDLVADDLVPVADDHKHLRPIRRTSSLTVGPAFNSDSDSDDSLGRYRSLRDDGHPTIGRHRRSACLSLRTKCSRRHFK